MRVIKRFAGVLAVLLGGVGVIVCFGGLVGAWMVRARTDTAISKIAGRVDETLAALQERTRQANQRIENTRDTAHELNDRVQQQVARWRDVPTEEAPDIDEIERQLYARIQLGKDWIGFVQSGVDLVEQFLQMLDSTSLFVQQESKTRADVVAAVRHGHEEIQGAVLLANEVKTQLENIRAHRDLDESAKQIRTLSSRIDNTLEKVQQSGQNFETGLVELATDVTNLETRLHRQLLVAALLVNLLLIWMAAAQASLAIHGWRLMRT